jgi:hypothetical protein
MSESNPYLAISRKFNASYGDVLCFRDAYIKKFEDLDYWQKGATRVLQHTPATRAIIDQYNGVQFKSFYVFLIKNDGGIHRKDFGPFEPAACFHNGRQHHLTGICCLFEGLGDRIAKVELGWNNNNEFIVRNTDDAIRYGVRLVDVKTKEAAYFGEEGLFFI